MTPQDPPQNPDQEVSSQASQPDDQEPRPVLLLLQQKQEATKLSFQLRLKGKKEEAEKASAKGEELGRQIDKLLNKELQDWLERAQALEGQLEKAIKDLETAVDHIKRDFQVAQNVTSALGLLDDTIAAAKELVSPG
ncbi:MAG TPA: hypothetical protein VLV83_23440 [Acidobacteriota bacterium]|nr:hypothetical protein [Acidobacteriota bacterium]